jgi:ribosomal protein L24E
MAGEIPMLTSSRYLMSGSPRCCMFCGEPFRPRDGYVEVWRTSAGQHFCSEFCADDAEEAQFRRRRAAAVATHAAGPAHI